VRVIMPAYGAVEEAVRSGSWNLTVDDLSIRVPIGAGLLPAGIFRGVLPGSDVPVYFIAERNLFARPKMYGYQDDPYRYAFFSRAALELAIAALGWRPDVVHANDWHTAPAVLWLATAGQVDDRYRSLPTIFTIHNLVHQGHAPWQLLDYLGVTTHGLAEEAYGSVNLMARGIYHATMINTVSPSYAREIMTREGGAGLDGLLRFRHFDLHGILNGIDDRLYDPAEDARLPRRFGPAALENRSENKRVLQERLGLTVRDDVPIAAMITRLDGQKGLDITGHVVHLLMNGHAGEAQFVLLGSGAAWYEDIFRRIADYHHSRMAVIFTYDPALASLIYGGADMFFMPSLFEPCGLGQMIAMRYGCVPIVRATGGLADTVHDGTTGFTFYEYSVDDFWEAVRRAMYSYTVDRESWRVLQRQGMEAGFSWSKSAPGYAQLYRWAIARVRGV
jgi:starch synthase